MFVRLFCFLTSVWHQEMLIFPSTSLNDGGKSNKKLESVIESCYWSDVGWCSVCRSLLHKSRHHFHFKDSRRTFTCIPVETAETLVICLKKTQNVSSSNSIEICWFGRISWSRKVLYHAYRKQSNTKIMIYFVKINKCVHEQINVEWKMWSL